MGDCPRADYAGQRPAINADSLCDLALSSQMTVLGISDARLAVAQAGLRVCREVQRKRANSADLNRIQPDGRIDVSCTKPCIYRVSPTGFEPVTFGSGDRSHDRVSANADKDLRESPPGVVPSVVPTSSPSTHSEPGSHALPDPELAQLVAAWPRLPEAVKAGILAMVKATGGSNA